MLNVAGLAWGTFQGTGSGKLLGRETSEEKTSEEKNLRGEKLPRIPRFVYSEIHPFRVTDLSKLRHKQNINKINALAVCNLITNLNIT